MIKLISEYYANVLNIFKKTNPQVYNLFNTKGSE